MVIGFVYDNVRPRKRDGRTQTTFSVAKVSPQIVTHLLWASFAWFRVCLPRPWARGPSGSCLWRQCLKALKGFCFRGVGWPLARGSSSVWPPASRCQESCQIRFSAFLLNRLPCRRPGKGRRCNLSQTRTLSSRFGTAATATWDLPPQLFTTWDGPKTDKVGSFTS